MCVSCLHKHLILFRPSGRSLQTWLLQPRQRSVHTAQNTEFGELEFFLDFKNLETNDEVICAWKYHDFNFCQIDWTFNFLTSFWKGITNILNLTFIAFQVRLRLRLLGHVSMVFPRSYDLDQYFHLNLVLRIEVFLDMDSR